MHAALKNNEPMNEVDAVDVVGGLPSINPVASFGSLETLRSCASANSTYRTPIGESLKVWGPMVVTAIVVPGGIVIALAMLVRRWYRGRAVRLATFA